MPLSEEHLRQLRELLGHRDAKIQAQGRELLVSLAHEPDALRGCRLAGAHLSQISLAGRDLRDTDLTAAWLEHADLSGTDLRGAILDDARLAHARLSDADLSGASMRGATLDEARLDGAILTNLDLRGASVCCVLPDDAAVFIDERTTLLRPLPAARHLTSGTDQPGLDLSGVTLSGLCLEDGDLRNADLSGGCFRRARLSHSDLSGADLSGVRMHRARLRGCWLRGANLSGADLSVADLTGADLTGADLTGANLAGANLTGATLDDAVLTDAVLDGARRGPLPPPPPSVEPQARLAALCEDPDWTIRRLALQHQARAGDAAAALAALIAAEQHSDSAQQALEEVLEHYTMADLADLPEHFRQRRWLQAIVSMRDERDPDRIVALLWERMQGRSGPLRQLIAAIPPDVRPAVLSRLGDGDGSFAYRKLINAFSPLTAPPPPLPRAVLLATVQDPALSDSARTQALHRLLTRRLIDTPTRDLLLTLTTGTGHLAVVGASALGWLRLDDGIRGCLTRTAERDDDVGAAAVTALLTAATGQPEHAGEILAALAPLIALPPVSPRSAAARQGIGVLLRSHPPGPRREALLRCCGRSWTDILAAEREVRRHRPPPRRPLLDVRALPDILTSLYRSPDPDLIVTIATDPQRAIEVARKDLSGPWAARTLIALRLCAELGPAAAPLLPLIRPHLARPLLPQQRAAAAAMAAIGDPAALPWLAAASLSPSLHLRRVVMRAMVQLAAPPDIA